MLEINRLLSFLTRQSSKKDDFKRAARCGAEGGERHSVRLFSLVWETGREGLGSWHGGKELKKK